MPSASDSCRVSIGYLRCRSRKGGAIFSGLSDTLSIAWQREQLVSTKFLPRCSAGVMASAEPVIARVTARQPKKFRIARSAGGFEQVPIVARRRPGPVDLAQRGAPAAGQSQI